MTGRGAFRFGDISRIELVLVILLLLFTSALFYPSLFSGFYMDDWAELERARDFEWRSWLVSFSPFSGLWRPMFYLFWAAVFKVAATNPVPYHVVHLGLHAFSITAVWVLARRLLGNPFAAMAAAFLFAIHKSNAFGIMWNSGATDTLAVTFAIPAFCSYLSYRDAARRKRWLLLLSCLLYYLALKSKLMAVTLPLLLISYELCCTSCRFQDKVLNILRLQWLYWAISAVYLWAFLAQGLPREDAYKPVFSLGHFLVSANWYLSRILFDIDPSKQTLLSVLLGAALLLAVGLRNRQMVFGWFWFLISLGPVAPLAAHRFETHLYLPIIGVCIYAGALFSRLRASVRPAYSYFMLTAIGLAFLYVDLPSITLNSRFLLTIWDWSQGTLESLRKVLPPDPSGSHIYVYPRAEGGLFDSGSSVRLLYRVRRDGLRVTVGEDKETIDRILAEKNAPQSVSSTYSEHYDPKTERLIVLEYSRETKQLSDVTSRYQASLSLAPAAPLTEE
jgi:hypothetical protein